MSRHVPETTRLRTVYAARQAKAGLYSVADPGHLFLLQERERRLLRLLVQQGLWPLAGKLILDVGCGPGGWLHDLLRWGAEPQHLYGIDLLTDRIAAAKRLLPHVHLRTGNATHLPYATGSVDVVLHSMALSSVLDQGMRMQMAAEMQRVLKATGAILYYDMCLPNPWNPHMRPLRRRELRQLFPGWRLRLRRMTLLPPLARRLAPWCWTACDVLARVPLLCTHYGGLIVPPR